MKKRFILTAFTTLITLFTFAQGNYEEGSFEVQVVDEEFFNTKIETDSDRNKEIVAENMTYYNKMIKAYNEKNYEDAQKWAEEAFLGSIGEKIQFKVYQKKFDYAHKLMQNQKLILFVSLCQNGAKIGDIQDIFDFCKEVLSDDRMEFVTNRANLYNETAKKQIEVVKTYTYE